LNTAPTRAVERGRSLPLSTRSPAGKWEGAENLVFGSLICNRVSYKKRKKEIKELQKKYRLILIREHRVSTGSGQQVVGKAEEDNQSVKDKITGISL